MNGSILLEAFELVHKDRGDAYGHPLDDFGRTAGAINALLAAKLKEPLVAEDIALIMCCVKLSRQVNAARRDNMTDLAGYAETWQMVIEERERRAQP